MKLNLRLVKGRLNNWRLKTGIKLTGAWGWINRKISKCFWLSASKAFPFMHHWDDGRGVRVVKVDGQKIDHAYYANTLTGSVLRTVKYDQQKGRFVREWRTGRVEIVWPNP